MEEPKNPLDSRKLQVLHLLVDMTCSCAESTKNSAGELPGSPPLLGHPGTKGAAFKSDVEASQLLNLHHLGRSEEECPGVVLLGLNVLVY